MMTFVSNEIPKTPEAVRRALEEAYWRGRADEARERAASVGVAHPVRPSPAAVFAAVGAVTGNPSFCKYTRSRRGYRERLIAAVLLREECRLSYPAMADLLGYKHHSAVMYGMEKATTDPEIITLVACAREHLFAQRTPARRLRAV